MKVSYWFLVLFAFCSLFSACQKQEVTSEQDYQYMVKVAAHIESIDNMINRSLERYEKAKIKIEHKSLLIPAASTIESMILDRNHTVKSYNQTYTLLDLGVFRDRPNFPKMFEMLPEVVE